MRPRTIRIISDLHLDDATSALQRLDALTPLLEGVDRLIVNGDAIDTTQHESPRERLAELKDFLGARVPECTLVAGNHDPDISDVDECFLAGESVWVTHGHVFYDAVAPWSNLSAEIRRRVEAITPRLTPAEWRRLETRYRVFRKVCYGLPPDHDPNVKGRFTRLYRVARILLNPSRVYRIFAAWHALPKLAAAFAETQRPRARWVITGHTHKPGAWSHGKITVLNTGSFCPPGQAQCVDLQDDLLTMRRVEFSRGQFRVGARVTAFSLAGRATSPLTA